MAGKGKSIDKKSKSKNKKSTKGQKNWRKNIDISDLEKKNLQKEQEKLVERDVKFMKDEDLFVIDTEPMKNIKECLLKKKTKRTDKVKKYSLNEEIKVKRMSEKIKKDEKEQKEEKPVEKEIKSLWDDEDKTITKLIKKKNSKVTPSSNNSLIKFPTLPIPHPGQSYNPSKQDISSLLHKIVDLNKRPESLEVETIVKEGEETFFPESEDEVIDQSCSNNPAVDDYTQRKSKSDKKKSIQKKLNRLKEKDLIQKKENKIELANEKSLNRIQKEQDANLKEVTEKKNEELRKKKEKEELLKMGFVEDADLLKDFQVKKDPIPLRKIKTKTNIISERFENILKRNVVGEFTHKLNKKARNRKLSKFHHKDLYSTDFGYSVGDEDTKLKIIE